MTNIAVVIAVSAYTGIQQLTACLQDGKVISAILKSNNRFSEVGVINGNQPASQVKKELIEFIAKYRGMPVNEFLFYFTGHGSFASDEFYFLLKDYDKNRLKQTSLENSELDNLVRPLSPYIVRKNS